MSDVITYSPCVIAPRKKPVIGFTSHGSKWSFRTKLSIDPVTGEKIADVGERIDLDATIQSYRDSTDIASIIARYNAGDETVLNVNSAGFTGDVTILPKDINDVVGTNGLFENVLDKFNSLPEDVRALWNNDPSAFYQSVITNEAANLVQAKKSISTEELTPVESKPEEGDK